MSVIEKIKGSKKDFQSLKNRFKKRMDQPDKPQEPRKRFPAGFLLFLLAAILIILTVQNLSNEKGGKVSFSHQVEHLVNLDLIQKDESRKTAQNDNLVTFTGKFKERLTDESKARYRFLELLDNNHTLLEGKQDIVGALDALQANVHGSAELFLILSGTPIPKGGFRVISPYYDTQYRQNSVVIHSLPAKKMLNLTDLQSEYRAVSQNPTPRLIQSFGQDTLKLIQSYRSPSLGIGTEAMKQDLRAAEGKVAETLTSNLTPQEALASYQSGLITLNRITLELLKTGNHTTLEGLRSVRNYLVDLNQYQQTVVALEENEAQLAKSRQNVANVTWFFNNKELSTKALEKQSPEEFSLWFTQSKKEWEAFAANKGTPYKAPDQPRNLVLEKTFKSQEPSPNYLSYIFLTIFPILVIFLILYFVFSRQMKGMGSGAMSFGKSPAKMLNKSVHKVTFKDVAGVTEAKEELHEVVDFLKDPSKFTALGARIPKGVLLIGSPGTGKTLIAKAVAGEAARPFFSISGSDFVEMFVGVGASRIRDLFGQAKKNAPCIVFIDEIDAVGRHRGAGIGGGHDEREQTLNQLLVEMDGFDTNEGVILMAATNRPDVLDKALLRPGRFDRNVVLDLPDIKGRFEILKVHAKKIKLDHSVDLMDIARATPGSSGADLMNILNESALLAARKGRSAVTQADTLEACDKVRYGKERRSLELDRKEKEHTAYHESGHAIVGLVVERGDPVEKVTIIPRGLSLGATHFVPEKNKTSYWRKELIDRLAVLMGGRVAEDLFVHDLSSGAQLDISQATKLARSMVCQWGMNTSLGPVAYDERSEEHAYALQGSSSKNYSEETARQIDSEVRKLLEEANTYAHKILTDNREKVALMTQMLIEFETLDKEDVHAIMNGVWDADKKHQKLKAISEAHRKIPPRLLPQRKPPESSTGTGAGPAPQGV
ncbi:MAG: ATP-dependent zinc metalloprotease FtsH [Simkaniaceae bacterium]|nr:ATP-dependent zinc metalloprotease FtsH [Simkaniaceae bacterium]